MPELIAQKFIPKGLFSNGLKAFLTNPDTLAWYYDSDQEKFRSVTDDGPLPSPTPDLVRLDTRAFEVELRFPLLRTQDNKEIGLTIKAFCKISPPREFLFQWKDRLDALNELMAPDLEESIVNLVMPKVVDRIAEYTYKQLAEERALTAESYKALLNASVFDNDSVSDLGLEITEVLSAEPELEELEKFRAVCEKLQKREEITISHEEAIKTLRLEAKERDREIKHAQKLADKKRQIELELVQRKTERDQELAQRKFEYELLEIEDKIAGIQDQQEERRRIKQERQNLEKQIKLLQEDFDGKFQRFERVMKEGTASIALLHELFETSVETLIKFNPSRTTTPEMVRLHFQELKGRYDKVTMKLFEATPRDIGCKKCKELRIDQSLAFEFISPKSGYATIINLGTSGRFWLHVPNAYIPLKQAKVQANQKYSIPGDLLPRSELHRHDLDYMECGPTGWEELIVLVTPTPLIGEADIFEVSAQDPFAQVLLSRMEKLIATLDEMPEGDVAFGTLGFVVT